jgi:hypothetical protein
LEAGLPWAAGLPSAASKVEVGRCLVVVVVPVVLAVVVEGSMVVQE